MTLKPKGAHLNIAGGISEFAVASPNAIAVVDGDRHLTYSALDERSRRVSNLLLDGGLSPTNRVAVLLGNRLEYPEIAAAIARVGMQMVPINPRLTAPEVEYIFGHSSSAGIILDDSLSEIASTAVESHPPKITLSIGGTQLGRDYESELHVATAARRAIEVDETEPFTVAYTSGTTGKPKGVMISHRSRSLTFYCTALEWGLGPGRRTIAVAPMYHGAGFAFGYGAVYTGGELWMLRAFDPQALLAMIQTSRAQSVFLVPTHAQMIRALGEQKIAAYDTSSLETSTSMRHRCPIRSNFG